MEPVMSEPTPQAIEAAARASYEEANFGLPWGECRDEWRVNYRTVARAALSAAAPYLIREARAAELEAAAEKLYETARAELRTADACQWPMARRIGYTDGMINARHVLAARAAAIRDGAQ
jgi:hypothetical protein